MYQDYEFNTSIKPEDIPADDKEYSTCESTACKYFYSQYNFKPDFDKDEYLVNNVTLDMLTESRICLNAADFIMNQERLTSSFSGVLLNGCCNGLLLSYSDKNHLQDSMIPMVYYEFSKPININNNSLQVEFNVNGIFKVE